MLNFTIGPVAMDEEIRKIGSEQIPYFRTSEFSELMLENETLMKRYMGAGEGARVLFLTGCAVGCFTQLPLVFSLADLLNACLLLPNLVALVILSPRVFAKTREYFLKGERRPCSSVRLSQKSC